MATLTDLSLLRSLCPFPFLQTHPPNSFPRSQTVQAPKLHRGGPHSFLVKDRRRRIIYCGLRDRWRHQRAVHCPSSRHQHPDTASNVIVTEARDRVGGNITTVERDGYLWEEGPNSFQPSDPILTMAVDSGLKDNLVLGDPNAPRFVLWEGKLRPVPSQPTDLLFFDLMSIGGKLRAGLGAIGVRPPPPFPI